MAVLAVALTALGVTIVWAALMLPIRARSELTPLGEELAAIRARGAVFTIVTPVVTLYYAARWALLLHAGA